MDNKPLIIGLAAIAVIGIAVLTMSKSSAPAKAQPTPMVQQPTTSAMKPTAMVSVEATGSAMEAGEYKAGKYTAEGNYVSPGGPEMVKVALTLEADGTIKDIEFTPEATRPNSVKFQGLFASGYKPLVLGKKIDEVKLDKVSGSSLTPMGFNDALSKIEVQAKG